MGARFNYFVMFAEMRTGSNFLESSLNAYPDIECLGEVFNPHFVGYPKNEKTLGYDIDRRQQDPMGLIAAIKWVETGIAGFRYFNDHDPRVLEKCLNDRRCAKIILTRNPIDSYVSWKIARETGQWKLTNVKHKRSAKIRFDIQEFQARTQQQRAFRQSILYRLQTDGQTAFQIDYASLGDVEVLNGLARFLGSEHTIEKADSSVKKQNPARLEDKVENFEEMEKALSQTLLAGMETDTLFEPDRGPKIPNYVAATESPLIYLPLGGRLDEIVQNWLQHVNGPNEALLTGFNQKTLRQWKRQHKGHRSFTVLDHPVARIHDVFCRHILMPGPACFADIRETLRSQFDHPLPKGAPNKNWDPARHRRAFEAFLDFLKANLLGQTAIRVDPVWSAQAQLVKGIAQFAAPDVIIRATDLQRDLNRIADDVGAETAEIEPVQESGTIALEAIYDAELESQIRSLYQRDYMIFGFGPWQDQAA